MTMEPQPRRRPDKAALLIAAVLAAIGAVIAWDAHRLGGVAGYARLGPTFFPYVIAAGFGILAVWTAVEAWRGLFPEREHDEVGPVVWIVGGLAAQMLLLHAAGFSIATGVLFAATARGFGRKPLWLSLVVGIAICFVVWVIFARGLQLSLPAGPLERLLP